MSRELKDIRNNKYQLFINKNNNVIHSELLHSIFNTAFNIGYSVCKKR